MWKFEGSRVFKLSSIERINDVCLFDVGEHDESGTKTGIFRVGDCNNITDEEWEEICGYEVPTRIHGHLTIIMEMPRIAQE